MRSNLRFVVRAIDIFRWLAFAALLITGVAKVSAALLGDLPILERHDPLIGLSFRHLFILAGVAELMVAGLLVSKLPPLIRMGLLTGLSTAILTYRLGLWWIGYQKPCSCLGNLTDAIGMDPDAADLIMKCILGVLFCGGFVSCLVLYRAQSDERVSEVFAE